MTFSVWPLRVRVTLLPERRVGTWLPGGAAWAAAIAADEATAPETTWYWRMLGSCADEGGLASDAKAELTGANSVNGPTAGATTSPRFDARRAHHGLRHMRPMGSRSPCHSASGRASRRDRTMVTPSLVTLMR